VGDTECLKIKPTEAQKKGEIRKNNKNVGKKDNHGTRGWTFISRLRVRKSVILLHVSKVLPARPSDNSTMEFKIMVVRQGSWSIDFLINGYMGTLESPGDNTATGC